MAKRDSVDRGGRRAGEAAERAAEVRRATERAVLELSGERGYGAVRVAELIERSGSNRTRFYATFAGKEDCYAAAYEAAVEGLSARLLGACEAAADWTAGMRVALCELAAFLGEDRDLAAGVLVGVHAAGGAAAAKRIEVSERLSRAIDRARRETSESRQSPPPITARFILDAIETTAIRDLSEGRALEEDVPGLLLLAIAPYFGVSAGWREVRRLGSGS